MNKSEIITNTPKLRTSHDLKEEFIKSNFENPWEWFARKINEVILKPPPESGGLVGEDELLRKIVKEVKILWDRNRIPLEFVYLKNLLTDYIDYKERSNQKEQ